MARPVTGRRRAVAPLPQWVRPQLTQLVDAAPDGSDWLHEIKYDGYRTHVRLDRGVVKLLTRTGLDWTHKYPGMAKAVASLDFRQAYLDGELCGVDPNGVTSFSIVQLASDSGNAAALVFFLFDLLYLDGEDFRPRPLIERKDRLALLLANPPSPPHYSDHQIGHGGAFFEKACTMLLEGIVSKRADAPYAPGNRGLWLKVKCVRREEFVVIGWTDPEGSRLLLARCHLAITIRTEGWFMPVASAAASTPPSFSGCRGGCSCSLPTRCRLTFRRLAAPASAHLLC
jgi:bifunctional non-homologous end joining protein LigD